MQLQTLPAELLVAIIDYSGNPSALRISCTQFKTIIDYKVTNFVRSIEKMSDCHDRRTAKAPLIKRFICRVRQMINRSCKVGLDLPEQKRSLNFNKAYYFTQFIKQAAKKSSEKKEIDLKAILHAMKDNKILKEDLLTPLCYVSSTIGRYTSLTVVDFSGHYIQYLPESMGLLSNLEKLFLQNNQLTSFPSSMSNLKKITHLNLSSNLFKNLPAYIARYPVLVALHLAGNPIISLPLAFDRLHLAEGQAELDHYIPRQHPMPMYPPGQFQPGIVYGAEDRPGTFFRAALGNLKSSVKFEFKCSWPA